MLIAVYHFVANFIFFLKHWGHFSWFYPWKAPGNWFCYSRHWQLISLISIYLAYLQILLQSTFHSHQWLVRNEAGCLSIRPSFLSKVNKSNLSESFGSKQPSRQNCRNNSVEECIFDNMALHIECRFNKNALLQCYFLAILPAGTNFSFIILLFWKEAIWIFNEFYCFFFGLSKMIEWTHTRFFYKQPRSGIKSNVA